MIGTDTVTSIGPARALFGAVCLGHLIRYGPDSGTHRLNCARFASHLILGVFGASVGHPQRPCDFAVYTPKVLTSGADLFADARCCSPKWVMAACRTVAVTLLQYDTEHAHLTLPVLALYEHVATHVTANTRYDATLLAELAYGWWWCGGTFCCTCVCVAGAQLRALHPPLSCIIFTSHYPLSLPLVGYCACRVLSLADAWWMPECCV